MKYLKFLAQWIVTHKVIVLAIGGWIVAAAEFFLRNFGG